jgi:phospholipid/cholesterol/gamma-HCH transport system ATP-binding protein
VSKPARVGRTPGGTVVVAPPVIEIHNLYKAFDEHVLFEDASLTIYEKETTAIVGESGSGKSVLLKMILGLIEPDEGQIVFKDKDVFQMDRRELGDLRRQVGYVFQNDALFDSMTVLENVGYGLREHTKQGDKEIRARAAECLASVGLEEWRLEQHPAELSGGQRKRVGIARAVAMRPKIVLYDEPTQGLDPQSITRIGDLIEQMQKELEATSIIATHDMRTAFDKADKIALLYEGRFDHVGTPKQFARNPAEPVREFIADAMEELQEFLA